MKFLIVNADDFGAGSGVNRGIVEAALHGILTSASLMVNMPGTAEAARMIRNLPGLSVGLHVNFTNEGGPPVVNLEDGAACRAELIAQLERFRELTAASPTHLDAHHNVHRNANLLPHFRDISRQYGLPLRGNCPIRYFPDFYGQWDGETHLEQISVENLSRMLRREVQDGYTELSCHPGYEAQDFVSSYSREREAELRTLCDPAIPEVLRECGIELTGYSSLARDLA